MSADISVFGFLNLFSSINSILIGIAIVVGKKSRRDGIRLRFSALLLCIGYLLAVYTLAYQDTALFSGFSKITHDLVSLLIAGLIFDYVRRATGKRSQIFRSYLPALVYFGGCLFAGSVFYMRVTIQPLIAIGALYTCFSVATYILGLFQPTHSGVRVSRQSGIEIILLAASSIYLLQLALLWSPMTLSNPAAAPVLAAFFASLFFLTFIFVPRRFELFFKPGWNNTNSTSSDDIEKFKRRILADKLYLDPDLSLDSLANLLGTKARLLSFEINSKAGMSFHDFVNGFRVEHAKRILQSKNEKRTSLDAIGLLSGFKSRSTFYMAFRKATGQTPGGYRNLNK